jgi:hypothetical protein
MTCSISPLNTDVTAKSDPYFFRRLSGRILEPGVLEPGVGTGRNFPGGLRRAMTRLWEPWVYWAYGAGFDRKTEQRVPEAGLQLLESRFVADELIKLLGASAR